IQRVMAGEMKVLPAPIRPPPDVPPGPWGPFKSDFDPEVHPRVNQKLRTRKKSNIEGAPKRCRSTISSLELGLSSGATGILRYVVVIRSRQSVRSDPSVVYIGSESQAFDLGGHLVSRDAVCPQDLNDIQEQRFVDGVSRRTCAIHICDGNRIRQVNLEKLLDLGDCAVATTFAITLIYEEFVLVDGNDFTRT